MAKGNEDVYIRAEEIGEFKLVFHMQGMRNTICSIQFQRSWPGDMTGIYMEAELGSIQ